ncbi:pyridoxal 5'-phosphate synthase SCDLUD_000031 [Saccharomycodes ludwigii]|uniref:pyridoxal 5'-phosphate synthase n=1 Tax=Saccharomycodes ludwigii TaxID=36035 RepID=UPI001E87A5C6|nr:hypothetical protein SCDLUD_000031 [Saccharomycodes ludwigii]KAH3902454.1 hypothetical protein SCDLUD_000031 [Saccharomycodes ludwigii]
MSEYPDHLMNLLKTSKYLHLATASLKDATPSVALMNYTYIPNEKTYKQQDGDLIILATHEDTGKYSNIKENPQVSLLIHDWVTAKKLSLRKNSQSSTPVPPSSTQNMDGSNNEGMNTSKLFNLLQELNQAELSQMSATLKGKAVILSKQLGNAQEFEYYQKELLKNNPDARCFITGNDIAIIKVKIVGGKISDNENNTTTI